MRVHGITRDSLDGLIHAVNEFAGSNNVTAVAYSTAPVSGGFSTQVMHYALVSYTPVANTVNSFDELFQEA